MTSITLIVTGKCEYEGLATSLATVFPQAEFATFRVDSFTSSPVKPRPLDGGRTKAEEMAATLIGAVDDGKRHDRTDFAIAIDDLELCNRDQPGVVTSVFHAAAAAHLETSWSSLERRQRAQANVRERCSFHLLVPMLEAYFFAAPAALAAISVTRFQLLSECDEEAFTTDDPGYPPADTPLDRRADLQHHPKRYLNHLLDGKYRETREGLRAIQSTNWNTVLADPSRTIFLRALFSDIAEMLGEEERFPRDGCTSPLTWNRTAPDRVLRNIGA